MTIDRPFESPNGSVIVIEDSLIGSDEGETSLNLRSSKSNSVPVVILRKLEDDKQYYVVSPRSSNRLDELKNLEDVKMELPSKKRERPRKTESDIKILSPSKIQKIHRKTDDVEDNVDSLCVSLNNAVKLTTPVKRSLNKTDCSDAELTDSVSSPRKCRIRESTTIKNTPKRGILKRLDNGSPIKEHENELVLSHKRQTRTPSRYWDDTSPLKSVKINLEESFRRSVLKSGNNLENLRREPSVKIERITRGSIARQTTPRKSPGKSSVGARRTTRQSYTSFFSYDTNSDDDDSKLHAKQSEEVASVKRRVLKSRNSSATSHTSELFLQDETESDGDHVSNKKENKSRLQSESDADSFDVELEDGDQPLHEIPHPKTPNRRKQVLQPRKHSTTSNALEKSPEKRPPREVVKTPKTPRNRKPVAVTPKTVRATPKTPKNRLKLLRDGVITPSMHSRSSTIPGDSTPLMKARSQLHVSYVPTSLPCREKEYLDVYNFVRGKLDDGYGGCMYISGVPGTGKTATVTSVIDRLQNDKKIPKFSHVSVNGMRLTEPRQSYVEIWKQLTGKTVPWEQAQNLLEERFTKKKNMNPVVMLIDELDILCTKRQDVVYNLLDWPTKSKDQLVVITIANTMDLPERLLMSRVTSRLGLTRLTFQAYTHKQLMEIVTKRLTGTNSFNPDAVQLVARKVASVSGDARRALDICRRAAEIAEEEGDDQLVNIMHINEALNAMITQPQVMAIRRCSRLQKLLLQAIVAEIERTGVEETTFSDVFRMLVSCSALDGFKMASSTVAQRAICELSAYRLIITDQKCSDIYQKIVLNVSVHDVYFALKKE